MFEIVEAILLWIIKNAADERSPDGVWRELTNGQKAALRRFWAEGECALVMRLRALGAWHEDTYEDAF